MLLTSQQQRPPAAFKITIHVLTMNRLASLRRLVASLERADYSGWRAPLVLHVDCCGAPAELIQFVQGLEWPHGPKQVHIRTAAGGLINAVADMWHPASPDDYALLLEDDVELSPLYFVWLVRALEAHVARPDPRVFGISLYTPKLVEVTNPNRMLDIHSALEGAGVHPDAPYYQQLPCSWGALYFPNHWREFTEYLQLRLATNWTMDIPGSLTNTWTSSWKKYFIEMAYVKGLYMLYPNFPGQASFSTNHMELGEHSQLSAAELAQKRAAYSVPLVSDMAVLQRVVPLLSRLEDLVVVDLFSTPLARYKPGISSSWRRCVYPASAPFSRLSNSSDSTSVVGDKFAAAHTFVGPAGSTFLLSQPGAAGHAEAVLSADGLRIRAASSGAKVAEETVKATRQGYGAAGNAALALRVQLLPNGTLVGYDAAAPGLWLWAIDMLAHGANRSTDDLYLQLHSNGVLALYQGCGVCQRAQVPVWQSSLRRDTTAWQAESAQCHTAADIYGQSNWLRSGSTLQGPALQPLLAASRPGGACYAILQEDGNFVIYQNEGGKTSVAYSTGSSRGARLAPYRLDFAHNGSFTLGGRGPGLGWTPIWASNNASASPRHFMLLDSACSLHVHAGFGPCASGAAAEHAVWRSAPAAPEPVCPAGYSALRDHVCRGISQEAFAHFADGDRCTALMFTASLEGGAVLERSILHYARSPVISAIVVVLADANREPPRGMFLLGKHVAFVRVASLPSRVHRFMPTHQIATACVLTLSEGVFVHLDDVGRQFDAWKAAPGRVVGLLPDLYSTGTPGLKVPLRGAAMGVGAAGTYPVALTRAAMLHKRYLHEFYCGAGRAAHAALDEDAAW
jgi:hypothetical protein